MNQPKTTADHGKPQQQEQSSRPPEKIDNKAVDGRQNDRAASNQSGMGSHSGQRDMTSGRHSGNQ